LKSLVIKFLFVAVYWQKYLYF